MKAKGQFVSHRFSFRIYSICTRCFGFVLIMRRFPRNLCLTIFLVSWQGGRLFKYSWFSCWSVMLAILRTRRKWHPLVYEGMNFNIHVHFSLWDANFILFLVMTFQTQKPAMFFLICLTIYTKYIHIKTIRPDRKFCWILIKNDLFPVSSKMCLFKYCDSTVLHNVSNVVHFEYRDGFQDF